MYEFCKRAVNNYENGSQKPLMCFVLGYRQKNALIGTELVFPDQSKVNSKIKDLGNCLYF